MRTPSFPEAIAECLESMHYDQGSGEISGVFCFDNSFIGFQGHFPGQPVLPAVVQLAAVRLLVEKSIGRELSLRKVKRAKFKRVVLPGKRLKVLVKPRQETQMLSLVFSISEKQEPIASGTIECTIPLP